MSKRLKSCPFCALSAYVEKHPTIFAGQTYSGRYPDAVAKQNHGFRVRCDGCGSQTCWWHYRKEAVEAWNTRTESE